MKFVIRTPRREGFVKVPLDGTTEYVSGIDQSDFEKANVSAVRGQQLTDSRQERVTVRHKTPSIQHQWTEEVNDCHDYSQKKFGMM